MHELTFNLNVFYHCVISKCIHLKCTLFIMINTFTNFRLETLRHFRHAATLSWAA